MNNMPFASLAPVAEDQVAWPPLQLRVRTYLAPPPPLELVTSARALLLRGDEIMVVRDPISVHIMPGGRREPNETLLETLEREVQEETGWTIRDARPLGVLHFHHLTPMPEGYRYPYPDFLHVVYVATAGSYDAARREVGGYEFEVGFRPLAAVGQLPLTRGERALLRAAELLPGG